MKRVLFFSRDPGGANSIIPIVHAMQNKSWDVILFGKDTALQKYTSENIIGEDIGQYLKTINIESTIQLLLDKRPDIVITGTSADDFTEKYLWKAAEELNIPSFAILDQWINYGIRFSAFSVSQMNEFIKDKAYPYMPSKIMVMDEIAKYEAVKEGLDPSRLVITGNPYLERIKACGGKKSSIEIEDNRKRIGINPNDFFITYASEPITDIYCETNDSEYYWGYNEKTIFNELINSLCDLAHLYTGTIFINIKLHPKEGTQYFSDLVNNFKHEKIVLFIENQHTPLDIILSSDLICGMSSMFLLECAILKKPIISIQIGLNKENPFILDRIGIIKSITDSQTLTDTLKKVIINKSRQDIEFNITSNSIENIINEVEHYL